MPGPITSPSLLFGFSRTRTAKSMTNTHDLRGSLRVLPRNNIAAVHAIYKERNPRPTSAAMVDMFDTTQAILMTVGALDIGRVKTTQTPISIIHIVLEPSSFFAQKRLGVSKATTITKIAID